MHNDAQRTALVERWLALTRVTLPSLAAERAWPISADHCFMRVCLDAAVGRPWREVLAAPAIRHASDAQLAAAVALAERCAAEPGRLEALNQQSLAWRKAARTRASAGG